jgi:hypothetical protein
MKIKAEDVDYIHVEDITFSMVMRDGTNLTISERGISTDTYSREQLADNVMAHIEQGKEVEILDDDEDVIIFDADIDTFKSNN